MLLLSLILAWSSPFWSGCTKIKGCTDKNAESYNSLADKDNGSCVYRYPSAVKVVSVPATNTDGSNWDLTDGPDVYVRFTKSTANNWLYTTATQDNFSSPVTFTLSGVTDYFTNEDWKYEVWDKDSPDADDLMASGTFNPLSGSGGNINIINGSTSLIIQYTVK